MEALRGRKWSQAGFPESEKGMSGFQENGGFRIWMHQWKDGKKLEIQMKLNKKEIKELKESLSLAVFFTK